MMRLRCVGWSLCWTVRAAPCATLQAWLLRENRAVRVAEAFKTRVDADARKFTKFAIAQTRGPRDRDAQTVAPAGGTVRRTEGPGRGRGARHGGIRGEGARTNACEAPPRSRIASRARLPTIVRSHAPRVTKASSRGRARVCKHVSNPCVAHTRARASHRIARARRRTTDDGRRR